MDVINNRLNFSVLKETILFYAVPFILYFALAAFFALGAALICSLYGRFPWTIDFLWGLVKITCG